MHKTTFQLETEIAALTAERTKLMQDVDTALDLQAHAQRAEAEALERIAELEAALSARATPAQPVPDAVDAVLLEMQPGGALYQPPSSMDEKRILDIAQKMPQKPWGTGSRRKDSIAFAWEVLKAATSPASDVSAPSPSSVGDAIRAIPLPAGDGYFASKGIYAFTAPQVRALLSEAAALAEQQGSEDTILLDWFDQQRTAYGFEGVQEGNEWLMNGPFATLRQALRECMAAAPQDWQKSETDHG